MVGMISTHWRRRHEPSEHDLARLDVLARQAADVLDRKRTQEELRDSEQRQAMLAAELQHRVRNIMAIIRSISARTADNATSVAEYAQLLSGRLMALARTQALLTSSTNGGVMICFAQALTSSPRWRQRTPSLRRN